MSKGAYYNMHRQMPSPTPRNTNSASFGTGTPSLFGRHLLPFVHHPRHHGNGPRHLLRAGRRGRPSPAYASMQYIMTQLPFGYILRAVHHWTTHFMVASVFLHMCRVYFTGATATRELNWLIGVALMALTIVFGLLRLPPPVGQPRLRCGHHRHQPGQLQPAHWQVHRYVALCGFRVDAAHRHSNVFHSRVHSAGDRHHAHHHSLVHRLGTRNCGAALIRREKHGTD